MCAYNKIRALFRFDESIRAPNFCCDIEFLWDTNGTTGNETESFIQRPSRCTKNSPCDSFVPMEVTRRICVLHVLLHIF